jgi:translation initiation factor IF-1
MDSNNSDKVKLTGVVTNVNNSIIFVEVQHGERRFNITAYPGGKLRKNSIMITLGDTVDVEVSPYDLTRGRIVYRHAK